MRSYFSTNRVLAAAILGIAVVTLFFACKKDNNDTDAPIIDEQDNTTIAVASHEGISDALYNDLFETTTTVITEEGYARTSETGGCQASVLLDNASPNVWPKNVTIDFGTACADAHGRVRSGKVFVKFSQPITQKGAHMVIRLANYKVNNIKVEGVDSIINLTGTDGKLKYNAIISGGKVTKDTLVWNYECDKTISRGDAAGVYSIEGTATLSYPNGNVAKVTTIAPLFKSISCPWIDKGKAKIELNNHIGTIDYGNGICDSLASIIVGDKQKEVTLPR
jgi:hypothetical protein